MTIRRRSAIGSRLNLESLRQLEASGSFFSEFPIPPAPPVLEHFGLREADIRGISEARDLAEVRATRWRWITAGVVTSVVLYLTKMQWFPFTLLPGLIAYLSFDRVSRLTSGRSFDEALFISLLTDEQVEQNRKTQLFEKARLTWWMANSEFERKLARNLHQFWLSKSGLELERAVGCLFSDLGYDVNPTPQTNDAGVDLFLKKEGRLTVVQCKAFGHSCGPAVIRETYGAMHAFSADDAIVVCPRGFTQASLEFAKGKSIMLMGVDDLTKAYYEFERDPESWSEKQAVLKDYNRALKKLRG